MLLLLQKRHLLPEQLSQLGVCVVCALALQHPEYDLLPLEDYYCSHHMSSETLRCLIDICLQDLPSGVENPNLYYLNPPRIAQLSAFCSFVSYGADRSVPATFLRNNHHIMSVAL